MLYRWPGNIRQLANEMRRIVALAEPDATLTPEHLSPEIPPAPRRTRPEPTEVVVRSISRCRCGPPRADDARRQKSRDASNADAGAARARSSARTDDPPEGSRRAARHLAQGTVPRSAAAGACASAPWPIVSGESTPVLRLWRVTGRPLPDLIQVIPPHRVLIPKRAPRSA